MGPIWGPTGPYVATANKIRFHFQFPRSPDAEFGGLIGWLFNLKCKSSCRMISKIANYLKYNYFWDGDGIENVTSWHWKFSYFCSRHTVGVAGDDIMFHILVEFYIHVCFIIPASIATLAQRWPNVNPYVGPTSAHQCWANVDLSIGPTLAQRLHANVGPTLCQHRPNVGTLTLPQCWHNVMPMVVCQRCTNIGPTEAALLAFCEGNPSVTDRSPVEQTVELSNQWFETPMWSTSM